MTLKELRKNYKLTQKEASEIVGMSLRTYVSYEQDELSADQLKLERIKEKLQRHFRSWFKRRKRRHSYRKMDCDD